MCVNLRNVRARIRRYADGEHVGKVMTSKYEVAKKVIEDIETSANGVEPAEAQEATMVLLVQELKKTRGVGYLRGILQYELDCLGRSDVYDVARGVGHS
jgi:hypothetical protein